MAVKNWLRYFPGDGPRYGFPMLSALAHPVAPHDPGGAVVGMAFFLQPLDFIMIGGIHLDTVAFITCFFGKLQLANSPKYFCAA